MKLLLCTLLIAAGYATPVEKRDWRLIPDGEYKLHLIDINADEDIGAEPFFNGLTDIRFELFTNSNPTVAQPIAIGNTAQLQASNFNPNLPSRFHIHGWLDGGANVPANPYRDAYLAQGNFNFFAVDWSAGGQTPNYILARQRVGECGRGVAAFLDFLNANGLPLSAVTLLGHSLGAHCAGHAGKQVNSGTIGAIVGLDPAGPLFSIDSQDRLDSSDAAYVEMICTDHEFLGFLQPLGHANFYPNGGSRQPGCEGEFAGVCSHQIVAHFMVQSINPANQFWGTQCTFANIMARNCGTGSHRRMAGEPVNADGNSPAGISYYLQTNPLTPFAQGPR